MRIIFVRHGEPNYELDCLTERGKLQAAAAARRLEREGIAEIYASPLGRAMETARYTAERLGLPITTLHYMHEISWGGPGIPENGHPWTLGDWMISREDFDFYTQDWRQHPYFAGNASVRYLDEISAKYDALLLTQGYRHEGSRFFCTADKPKTIAVFSHGGSGACVLSHLLALPFPYVATVLPYEFTSVIILEFPVRPGEYVHPRIELFNDAAHILNLSSGLVIQQTVDGQKKEEEA
ncbi:MAG: histidine phosphatase family protein [Clostridia bacterium]|nr:histidine phosphatase family protein [Clostridia bacterium]